MFIKIDKEDDGAIYLKEIVLYLRAMNEDIDKNLEVRINTDLCMMVPSLGFKGESAAGPV